MLTNIEIRVGEESYGLTKDLFSIVRSVAKARPGTVAAEIIHLEGIAYGNLDDIKNPELGFYEVGNFGNLLTSFGFKLESYPETRGTQEWNQKRTRYMGAIEEAKAKGERLLDVPPLPPLEPTSWINSYGVADNLQQIKDYYKEFIDDSERIFVIGYSIITRDLENKGQGGGWRWHKWGPYIGEKTPTTEYLDDEPEIDQVIIFHIHELLKQHSRGEQ